MRAQARNLKSGDISLYFKNNVKEAPLISGVISGFLGAAMGSMTFMTLHNYLTTYLYSNVGLSGQVTQNDGMRGKLQSLDWRLKNLLIFSTSDFCASFTKVMFEARKLRIQMCDYSVELPRLVKATQQSWAPMMFRDVLFRFIHLSFFYGTIHIEHKPKLLYSVP